MTPVRDLLGALGRWPLLLAAVICFSLGLSQLNDVPPGAGGEALVMLGGIMAGAWIALYARDSRAN